MNVEEMTRHVAAHGLPGSRSPISAAPLDDRTWSRLVQAVNTQRLAGLLQAAIDAGALEVTEPQRDEAGELHLRWCLSAIRLERALLGVADVLQKAMVSFLVLKGTAVAHLDYPDPAMRMFGDNDLLVPAEDLARAQDALETAGYVRPMTEARSGFDRRFGKGATFRGPDGDELDLHRTLVFGTFGFLIEPEELFGSAVSFELGGHELRALGPENRLLHACYHAALGDPRPRLSSVRDVAQLLMEGEHDSERALRVVRRWRAESVLDRAVKLCREHLGVQVSGHLVDAVEGYDPTRRERRAIASYVGTNRSFATKVLASLPYLEGIGTRFSFLRAAVFPDPDFTATLGGSGTFRWLRRGARSLIRGVRR